MSAATADRLLSSQRRLGQRGLSTTRAGTLLKQQIPIRTFEEWKETQPGFVEADLVAHCGADIEGGYLYTLTLTDVAAGWTEYLPLLYRSQEMILAAFQQGCLLFQAVEQKNGAIVRKARGLRSPGGRTRLQVTHGALPGAASLR
jgi:hypothetical protein